MKKNNKGFSLVELMVVLVLMSIICIAIMPNVRAVRRQEAKKAANELCLDLVTLRTTTRASTSDYTLTLVQDPTTLMYNSYTITPELLTASGSERDGNKDNSQRVNIRMQKELVSGDPSTRMDIGQVLYFEGSEMKTTSTMGAVLPEIIITITSGGTINLAGEIIGPDAMVEVRFNYITGYYSLNVTS